MKIIQLKANSIKELNEIVRRFSLIKSGQAINQDFLKNNHVYFLVAYHRNEPVGYLLGYQLLRLETSQPKYLLYDIEVAKDYRRQGIGRRLVKEFKKICQSEGASEIWVPTNKSNIPATRLYESTGGRKEVEDDVIYIFKL